MLWNRISSLALLLVLPVLAAPAPVQADEETQLRVLNIQDFDDTIKSGLWFIEYFSPHCPHCIHFEPTWRKLVAAHMPSEATFNFHMAQVNCIASGDLCSRNNVDYYPQMRLYAEGEQTEVYSGDRKYDPIKKYLDDKILNYTQIVATKEPETVAESISRTGPTPNPDGKLLSLDEQTFAKYSAMGPLFIKFYAPWCGHCKKLAPVWEEFASQMKGIINIAEVNCDENSRLCQSQGVSGYPMLFYYRNGAKVDYRKARTLEALKEFVEKSSSTEMKRVMLSEFENIANNEKVVFLYLHAYGTSSYDVKKVEAAAEPLMGDPPIYRSLDPALWQRYHLDMSVDGPTILAIKGGEVARSFAVTQTTSANVISKWLEVHRLPIADELTSDNFQAIMKSDTGSYVVLVAIDRETRGDDLFQNDFSKLKDMATLWSKDAKQVHGRPVQFVWMDAGKWSKWLKSMYGIKSPKAPAVVITDHQNLVYYDTDASGKPIGFDTTTVHHALEAINRNALTQHYSENFIERTMRSLHNKIVGIESFFANHLLLGIGMVSAFVSLIIVLLYRAVRSDTEPLRKRQRLD
ncbi:hypothetical protein FRC02_008020 [Tulasnella sp. 418]|nr:hypothetical protein FRC02_008020 [Tulasnella sp. 418]